MWVAGGLGEPIIQQTLYATPLVPGVARLPHADSKPQPSTTITSNLRLFVEYSLLYTNLGLRKEKRGLTQHTCGKQSRKAENTADGLATPS